MAFSPRSTEHRIPRDGGSLSVRVFAGAGPAYLLLHGFPDNSHIYDRLIPHLVHAGRQVVAIDFLGFGASDKPGSYSFEQQLNDVEAVVDALALDEVIPVGHDAGGPAAVNFALRHPELTASVVMLNAFYGEAPGLLVPEIVDFFSIKRFASLHKYIVANPQKFAWFFGFQRAELQAGLSGAQRELYTNFLGSLIDQNFKQQPSALDAFVSMTAQLHDELAANTARLAALRKTSVPFRFIWGRLDAYLHVSTGEYLRSQLQKSEIYVLDAGHWPQIDAAAETAELMLKMK